MYNRHNKTRQLCTKTIHDKGTPLDSVFIMKNVVFKAVLGLKTYTATNVLQKSALIQSSIGANATIFATPDPSLASTKAKTDALQATTDKIQSLEQQIAVERDKQATQIHDLKQALENTGAYVEKTAKTANNFKD